MDPVIISNQVFESIQTPTLQESESKGVILYANRYSGNGEVELEDTELLDLLNSSMGDAGNNVLVQLRKKMSGFRNGPWYIDSRDGYVYIHNRKYTQDSVYSYNYQFENGEVLNASFRMVDVHRGIRGLGGFVNALSKVVGMLEQKIDDKIKAPDSTTFETSTMSQDLVHVPVSTRVDLPKAEWNQEHEVHQRERERKDEVEKAKKKYDATSQAERRQEKAALRQEAINRTDLSKGEEYVKLKNPQYKAASEYYREMLSTYGANHPYTKAAYQEKVAQASKVKVPAADSKRSYGYYTRLHLSAGNIEHQFGGPPPQSVIDNKVNAAVKEYVSNHRELNMTDYKPINVKVTLVDTKERRAMRPSYSDYYYKFNIWAVTYDLSFFGYGRSKVYIPGDRFLKDPPRSGDITSMIKNAAANIGRGKREKKFQATLKVIGNPILEPGMQIDLQNVGKKNSGLWYIHNVSHDLNPGSGYITNMELTRQQSKATSTGICSTIHTQSYTVDNETPDPNSTEIRTSKSSSKKAQTTTKANVSKNNKEYKIQDVFDEPLTWEESKWINERASAAQSEAEASRIIREELFFIADVRMANKKYGTNHKSIKAVNKKDGSITLHKNMAAARGHLSKDAGTVTSKHYVRFMKYYNDRRSRK